MSVVLPPKPNSWEVAAYAESVGYSHAVEVEEFGALLPGEFPFAEQFELDRKVHQNYEPKESRYLANHRGHTMFLRPDETRLTGEVIKAFIMTGTKNELVECLREMRDIGFEQVRFHTAAGHEKDMLERWADVMSAVIQ